MKRDSNGHRIGCGTSLAIVIGSIIICCIIASDNHAKGSDYILPIIIGGIIGYGIASFIESSDLFDD